MTKLAYYPARNLLSTYKTGNTNRYKPLKRVCEVVGTHPSTAVSVASFHCKRPSPLVLTAKPDIRPSRTQPIIDDHCFKLVNFSLKIIPKYQQ